MSSWWHFGQASQAKGLCVFTMDQHADYSLFCVPITTSPTIFNKSVVKCMIVWITPKKIHRNKICCRSPTISTNLLLKVKTDALPTRTILCPLRTSRRTSRLVSSLDSSSFPSVGRESYHSLPSLLHLLPSVGRESYHQMDENPATASYHRMDPRVFFCFHQSTLFCDSPFIIVFSTNSLMFFSTNPLGAVAICMVWICLPPMSHRIWVSCNNKHFTSLGRSVMASMHRCMHGIKQMFDGLLVE